jgi:hypothetical protein
MGTRTVKRPGSGASAKKKKATPKFLLIKDADSADSEERPSDAQLVADEDWPEREDIRNSLVDQVSTRFGISQDVAIRAVNDMLRLS